MISVSFNSYRMSPPETTLYQYI
uniref:Uncharacterized protein n=1 Tax=Rhizophora mucronata TaxID=61149 RepID=A0A2P2JBZ7_RHIMU